MLIELTHVWTKEIKVFDAETITKTYVSIRWGQSGTYDLNLAANVLTARSQKAQRKGERPLWVCSNIEALRGDVAEHFAKKETRHGEALDTRRAHAKHIGSMPRK